MKKSIGIVIIILFSILCTLSAQKKNTISGYIKDAANGEAMTGATVYTKENYKGTITNTYGFYSLTVDTGTYTFQVSFIGYETYSQLIHIKSNQTINIELNPISIQGKEVIITDVRTNENIETTDMGKTEIKVEAIKKMPMFFGEADIIKTIQLLPGIQTSGEGSSGYHVRGGGIDQNLYC